MFWYVQADFGVCLSRFVYTAPRTSMHARLVYYIRSHTLIPYFIPYFARRNNANWMQVYLNYVLFLEQ